MSRRVAAFFSVALVGGVLVAACGSNNNSSSGGGGSGGSKSTGTTSGGKVLVDCDVARLGQLHPDPLQPNTAGVRHTADADEQVAPFDDAVAVRALHGDPHVTAGLSFDPPQLCLEVNCDPFVVEELKYRRAKVRVFTAGQLLSLLDHGHSRAEAAHEHDHVPGDVVRAAITDLGHLENRIVEEERACP